MRLTGKKYLMFFCWLLTAPKARITKVDFNHERIHAAQMRELLYIFFYPWYGVEWIIRLFQFWKVGRAAYRAENLKFFERLKDAFSKLNYMAYRNISLEREAYQNEDNSDYLQQRQSFHFLQHLKLSYT